MEELHSRREVVKIQTQSVDVSKIENDVRSEERRRQKKIDKQNELKSSDSYAFVEGIATVMDKYCLDPILGLFGFGILDVITSLTVLPSIYVSAFKIRSIPLTLAVLFNAMVDMCLGCLPFIGWLTDFLYRANMKNYQLIVGFVEDDKEIISRVNRRAVFMCIFLVILGFILYKLITLAMAIWDWIAGIFA